MQIIPCDAGCGATVADIDLNVATDEEVAQIKRAHAEYGVVVFRDQELTPEGQLAVAERFGSINVNRFFTPLPENPRVALVVKEPEHAANIGGAWHTDHSYDDEPAMGSMLYAKELPPEGGDTLFASMYAAYDALSDGLKQTLHGMRAVHSSRHVFGRKGRYAMAGGGELDERYHNAELATQDAVHPVVVRHPASKRPILYVNPGFTLRFEGWTDEESMPLLMYLYGVGGRPEHVYRHRWEPGTLAFWDNRCTWHQALNDYPGHRRVMHRVTIDGEGLDAFAAA